ncbi:hypothetical protein BOTCAL_0049g00280 [Botryotinia calthae]|uniref:Haloacid dehalogenase-like hydrolase n=1 Tax=Botryotinia calthae TaxID=38488 RepID=A0A4Y8DB39_9HELO|nr:hypothetical protein BOTCAL_0049g00280 [Botryotinia calthae]
MQPSPLPVLRATKPKDERFTHFIFDFDCTITMNDTSQLIADTAIAHHLAQAKDFTQVWQEIFTTYDTEHTAYIEGYEPKWDTLEGIIERQRNQKEVEIRSINRLNRSGMFAGIHKAEWRAAGGLAVLEGKLKIRKGFKEIIDEIERRNGVWGVVSVSFSKDFIKGVLEQYLGDYIDAPILANAPDEAGILRGPEGGWEPGFNTTQAKCMNCNSGPFPSTQNLVDHLLQIHNREFMAPLTTSDTKLGAMHKLLQHWKLDTTDQAAYYGDSITDIECLFDRCVKGILVGDGGGQILAMLDSPKGPDFMLVESYTTDFENIIIRQPRQELQS